MSEFLVIGGIHIVESVADAKARGLAGAAVCWRDSWFPSWLCEHMKQERIGIVPAGYRIALGEESNGFPQWTLRFLESHPREPAHITDARRLAAAYPEHARHVMIIEGARVVGAPTRLVCSCGKRLKFKLSEAQL